MIGIVNGVDDRQLDDGKIFSLDFNASDSTINLTPELIRKYIDRNSNRKMNLINNYDRFTTKCVPIFSRKIGYQDSNGGVIENPYKINRKVNNDFAGYIVRTKASYMCSNSPIIEVRDLIEMKDNQYKKLAIALDDFKKINSWEGLMTETAEVIGACGEGSWIISMENIYGRGVEKINNVKPWEVIEVIKDELYIRYFVTESLELEEKTYVDVYDKTSIKRYEYDGGFPVFKYSIPHLFKKCPVILFKNNDEKQSDFHNVKTLIDQYDRTLSDINSEVEQFRLAYLVLTGVEADEKVVAQFQQTGVFQIKKPDGKAEFITKATDINSILELLQQVEKNIFRFAESFDSVSDTYTGNLTNFAVHFKTAPMKGRAKKTVSFIKSGLYNAFSVISDTWNTKGVKFNVLDLEFKFNFDDARNTTEELDVFAKAGGIVSNETLLSTLSFVNNPSNEMERVKGEGRWAISSLDNKFKTNVEKEHGNEDALSKNRDGNVSE